MAEFLSNFQINTYIGYEADLLLWPQTLPSARICPLTDRLSLVPVTTDLRMELRTWFERIRPRLKVSPVGAWGWNASRGTLVGHLACNIWMYADWQCSLLWNDCDLILREYEEGVTEPAFSLLACFGNEFGIRDNRMAERFREVSNEW